MGYQSGNDKYARFLFVGPRSGCLALDFKLSDRVTMLALAQREIVSVYRQEGIEIGYIKERMEREQSEKE